MIWLLLENEKKSMHQHYFFIFVARQYFVDTACSFLALCHSFQHGNNNISKQEDLTAWPLIRKKFQHVSTQGFYSMYVCMYPCFYYHIRIVRTERFGLFAYVVRNSAIHPSICGSRLLSFVSGAQVLPQSISITHKTFTSTGPETGGRIFHYLQLGVSGLRVVGDRKFLSHTITPVIRGDGQSPIS